MRPNVIRALPTPALVERYLSLCIAQGQALEREEIGLYNSRYQRLKDIEDELKARPGDHRRELIALLSHPDPQVRLLSAHATLALDSAARATLETLRQQPWLTQALAAGSALDAIDEGIYRPD